MKRTIRHTIYILAAGILLLVAFSQTSKAQEYDGTVTLQTFYDELAPFGQWVSDQQYGYVWVPDVGDDFRPYYTQGRWVMTDYGNTWVSDYQWGWAPFHYGRWMFDSYYGWVWVPGTTWGPAWVSWRYSDAFCGWAPLSPGFDVGASYNGYYCPDNWWIFIDPQYIYKRNYYNYFYGTQYNGQIIAQTPFLNNTYANNNTTYVIGPRASQIEHVTNRPVPVVPINAERNPGKTRVRNDAVNMYRPMTVNAASANGRRPTPPSVVRNTPAVGQPQAVSNAIPPYKIATRPTGYSSYGVRQAPGDYIPQQGSGNMWNAQPVQAPRTQTINAPVQRSMPIQSQPQPVQRSQSSSQGNIRVVQPSAQPSMQSRPMPQGNMQPRR